MDENKKPKLLNFKGSGLALNEVEPGVFEVINVPFFNHLTKRHYEESLKADEATAIPQRKLIEYPEVLVNQLLEKSKTFLSHTREGEKGLLIESFSLVATKEIKEEAAILVKSLRMFHDQPILVLCDAETKNYLEDEKFTNLVFRETAGKEELEKAKQIVGTKFDSVDTFHRIECIYKKMECIEHAVESFNNTLFLDADIVVVDNLQEHFTKLLALSPHYHSPHKSHMTAYCGIFNAGYIFCADKKFPKLWKDLYANRSTFYEQQGMNYISEHYDIDIFPKAHNIGFWRDISKDTKEPIDIKIRSKGPERAKSFHVHMLDCIDFGNNYLVRKKNEEMRRLVLNFLLLRGHKELHSYIRSKMHTTKKTAFIHFGKCAGVYVNKYLRKNILHDAMAYNSWDKNILWKSIYGADLHRDWTEAELRQIARGLFHKQSEFEYQFAHNHHINWDMAAVKEFKNNNWFTFTFIREPKNLICSLYFYSRSARWQIARRNPMEELIIKMSGQPDPFQVPLNAFFEFVISNKGARELWVLPDYIDELDYVAEFNDKNFALFLKKYYNHEYIAEEKANTSGNKGFDFYYKSGDISEAIKNKIEADPEYKRYSNYLDDRV